MGVGGVQRAAARGRCAASTPAVRSRCANRSLGDAPSMAAEEGEGDIRAEGEGVEGIEATYHIDALLGLRTLHSWSSLLC